MRIFAAACLLVTGLSSTICSAQTTTFHSETRLVTLTFSARDADGRAVGSLNADDFSVYEDGVEQKIGMFSRQSELPLTLGLLVDSSESQDKFLKEHLRDIRLFLASVLRPQDQAFAVCFGNHLRLVSDFSSDAAKITDGLARFNKGDRDFPEMEPDDSREGGSAVYDSIFASVAEKLNSTGARRKALILFSDGEENASAHDEIDTIAAAQSADTLVYAIRYTKISHHKLTADNRHGIAGLKHIAEQTGGRDFDALHVDVNEAFRQIGDELRTMYFVGYYSTNKAQDHSFRKIVIEPHTEGITLRAKTGYYAQ
ncbi:VWA domain-containing protein [Acidicapsa dinghuensis]|uniref:VWA domain-containing protein n=1 Tax=Acidicapsa dinghuensis TaxID=2218256 RepID=A0ABW1ECX9_9BACT|nr:VWA domain-containing protein [Acidicapsa dinghuensis]